MKINTQVPAWGKRAFTAAWCCSQLDFQVTVKIDDNLQTIATVLWKVRVTRWLGKWSLRKEQVQLGLAQFLLSWWLLVVNGPMARAKGHEKFRGQCKREVKEEGPTERKARSHSLNAVSEPCPRDHEALSQSLSLSFWFPICKTG